MPTNVDLTRKFSTYMNCIEQNVMIPCIKDEVFKQKIMVSIRKPKLLRTPFGKFIGEVFECEDLMAFNYYGMMKTSTGFIRRLQQLENRGVSVRSLECNVLYFSTLKISHINRYAKDMITDFSDFKEWLVNLRAFKLEKDVKRAARPRSQGV